MTQRKMSNSLPSGELHTETDGEFEAEMQAAAANLLLI